MRLIKFMAVSVVSASLLAMGGFGQTAAELLQKGIFTQQSTGDLDGAIKIFRQIVNSNPPQRVIAAQAQYQLVQCLMHKNDFAEASQEMAKLARDYPDYKDLMKNLAQALAIAPRPAGVGPECPNTALGAVQNGHYHHNKTGVEFTVPSGWSVPCTMASGIGEMATLTDASSKTASAFVWMVSENIPSATIHDRLHWDLAEKEGSRRSQYAEQYGYRPDSVQDTVIGGQQALVALADYVQTSMKADTAQGSTTVQTKMTEIHTWIYTTKTRVYISGRVPTSDLADFQNGLQSIVQSIVVP